MKGKHVSVAQLQQLAIDYGIKKMTIAQLSEKYGWDKKKVSNTLGTARKKGMLPRVRKSRSVSQDVKQPGLFHESGNKLSEVMDTSVLAASTPPPSTPVPHSGYRKISFPGGFTVHVSKKSQAKLFVNENGDIALVNE